MRLHFQQAAEGPLEFEFQTAAGVEILQLHFGGKDPPKWS